MKLTRIIVLSILAGLALPLAAHAGNTIASQAQWSNAGSQHDDNGHKHFRLRVALWGDEFYADDPAVKAWQEDQTIHSMNAHDLDFTIFVGDTKNGHSLCTNEAIGQDVINIFNRLDVPTVYSLGDNEWTDCHRTSNGSYDPLERLSYLRTIFFDKNTMQGPNPIMVERQGELGQAYSENSRFVKNNVEFVAINVIGSNNNFAVTDHECHKKSNRTQTDCDAAIAEYRARNKANLAWLKSSFALARQNHYAGILIAIQADMFGGIDVADGNYNDVFLPTLDPTVNGFADFFHTLIDETQQFNGKVLLVHGDSHYFRIDKPMVDANGQTQMNFTRVEVFGNADNSWVEMTVDPSTKNVFSFTQVDLQ